MPTIKHWVYAARPKTLSAALIPVVCASALAAAEGHFKWQPALLCVLFAALMQIAANFINDLYDFLKGTDRDDRLGPDRACAKGWIAPREMRRGIAVMLTLACACGLCLLFVTVLLFFCVLFFSLTLLLSLTALLFCALGLF